MLRVGLTGGIGAGKSSVSRLLTSYGARVIDADLLAREVVEPGTAGLAAVVDEFGPGVLSAEGALDRPALDRQALGRLVFGDKERLARLNAILHPRIAALSRERFAAAEADGVPVLVHDVPLLVENGLAPSYHLVLVVTAPEQVRLQRLVRLRGMPEQEARGRLAAQAGDEQRRAVADVLVDNAGTPAELGLAVREVWDLRIRPYAANLAAGRPAARGSLLPVPWDPRWPAMGERLVARLRHLCGAAGTVALAHVGDTAVPGRAAPDVIELHVEAAGRPEAAALRDVLAAGGFPPRVGDGDPPGPGAVPGGQLHQNADPGRPADVHVRVADGGAV